MLGTCLHPVTIHEQNTNVPYHKWYSCFDILMKNIHKLIFEILMC